MSIKKFRQIQPTANDVILEETSLALCMPKNLVKEVVDAQSAFTSERMAEGALEGVLWPAFCKIRVKASRVYQAHLKTGNSNIKKNTLTPGT